eukprot:827425-Pelagomonas_calceolata.AAC.1
MADKLKLESLTLGLDGMCLAGALLLRNTKDDHVYYIVADELKQIDLSSDQVVAQLFKDGQWEAAAAPLYFGQVRMFAHGS